MSQPISDKINYWLIAGELAVADQKDQPVAVHRLNVLIATKDQNFTRSDIAKAQHALQARYMGLGIMRKGHKITDAFIYSASYLGLMTPEEFHKGFDMPAVDAKTLKGMN